MKTIFFEIEMKVMKGIFTRLQVNSINIYLKILRKCARKKEVGVYSKNKKLMKEKLSKEEIRKRLTSWNKATNSRRICEFFELPTDRE